MKCERLGEVAPRARSNKTAKKTAKRRRVNRPHLSDSDYAEDTEPVATGSKAGANTRPKRKARASAKAQAAAAPASPSPTPGIEQPAPQPGPSRLGTRRATPELRSRDKGKQRGKLLPSLIKKHTDCFFRGREFPVSGRR
jgi:hypothetical protein